MLKNTLRTFLSWPAPTAGRITAFGNGLGIVFATVANPAVPEVLVGALFSPLLFLVVYGPLALLMGAEFFLLRKLSTQRRLQFVAGPLLIIAALTFFLLNIIIPNF